MQAARFAEVALRRGVVDQSGLPRYIVKSKQHRGIHVLWNASRSSLAQEGSAIVQERVVPLLLSGFAHCFDIGLYVLVTSLTPLRVYAHRQALVRFSTLAYPQERELSPRPMIEPDTPSLKSMLGSRSPQAAQDFDELPRFVIKDYDPIWRIPTFHHSLSACKGSAACALRDHIRRDGFDDKRLWSSLHTIAASLVRSLRPTVLDSLRQLRLQHSHVFELFRFDFMVDERARPVLMEVNLSPNLVGISREDSSVKRDLIVSTLRLAEPRLRPTASLPQPTHISCESDCCKLSQLIFCAASVPNGCLNPSQLRALRMAQAELEHSREFELISPHLFNGSKTARDDSQTRALDDLQACWLSSLRTEPSFQA